jgi:hypothetical protein
VALQVDNIQPLLHRCYGYLDSAMVQELLQDRLQGLVHQLDALSYNMCKVGHVQSRLPHALCYSCTTPAHRPPTQRCIASLSRSLKSARMAHWRHRALIHAVVTAAS